MGALDRLIVKLTAVRHVKDASYWHLPTGTPILAPRIDHLVTAGVGSRAMDAGNNRVYTKVATGHWRAGAHRVTTADLFRNHDISELSQLTTPKPKKTREAPKHGEYKTHWSGSDTAGWQAPKHGGTGAGTGGFLGSVHGATASHTGADYFGGEDALSSWAGLQNPADGAAWKAHQLAELWKVKQAKWLGTPGTPKPVLTPAQTAEAKAKQDARIADAKAQAAAARAKQDAKAKAEKERWAAEREKKIKAFTEQAYRDAANDGGVTLDIYGYEEDRGLAYEPYPDAAVTLNMGDFSPEAIRAYVDKQKDRLREPDTCLAIYEEDGKVRLGIRRVGPALPVTIEDALDAGCTEVTDLSALGTDHPASFSVGRLEGSKVVPLYPPEAHPYLLERDAQIAKATTLPAEPVDLQPGDPPPSDHPSQDVIDYVERIRWQQRMEKMAEQFHWPPRAIKWYGGDNEYKVICDRGHQHYGQDGAAGALVRATDETGAVRIMLQKRAAGLSGGGGQWCTVGGAIGADETPQEGAARESGEELGVDLSTLPSAASLTDAHGGWAYSTVVLDSSRMFTAHSSTHSWESAGIGWFTPEEIDLLHEAKMLHPGFASTWPALRDLMASHPPTETGDPQPLPPVKVTLPARLGV